MGDDDSLFDSTTLGKVLHSVEQLEGKSDLLYGLVKMIDGGPGTYDGQIWRYGVDYDSLRTRPICHQACFYRTSSLIKAGGYDTTYPICADWELNLRLWNNANPTFIDAVICNFRRGGLSTHETDSQFFNDLEQIWKRNLPEARWRAHSWVR